MKKNEKTFRGAIVAALLAAAFALLTTARAGDPAVTVVTGPDAPPLEAFAAKEMTGLLERLFEAEVTVRPEVPDDAKHLIFLGSPETNPAVAKWAGEAWPNDLGDQGHLLKSVAKEGEIVLIVGGGSPVATLWAVYEFGHHIGMRYTLHEDFPPVEAPEFRLSGFDESFSPNLAVRAWRTIDAGAAGQASWGIEEHRRLLGQLAKLKFNRVVLATHPWQPFYDFESGETPKTGGVLWEGGEFPVSGDTAGRAVFDGAEVFENPDFSGKTTDAERVAAARELGRGILSAARELGMTAAFESEGAADPEIETIALSQPRGGVLPQFSTAGLPDKLDEIREEEKRGFAVKCWIPGSLDPGVYYLSRAAFDAGITPREALASLVTPICGDGVAERLATGFAAIEEVSALIESEDPDFAVPDPAMFLKHYASAEPAPEWWGRAAELYGAAVNEMYRGNTRAREGARPFLLYHAKVFTFALHYMTAVSAAREAGIAREAKDAEAWAGQLEAAAEALHNALGIYADVARDNSDRGVIAVLNEYAYRPVLEELDQVPLE
ncbi:MAG: alpha-glucuronidase family glycosyl hydrolase [Verrucomicrobiales bacterium]